MYRKTPVPIPASTLISKSKQKSGTYVNYEIDRVYDPEKQFNVPVRRSIGKVCDTDPSKMFPNERYFEFFGDGPVAAKVEDLPEATRSCCIKLGAYLVIEGIARELQLEKLLRRRFGSRAGLLLDLAAFALIEEGWDGCLYPGYAFCHPLFAEGMRIASGTTVLDLLESDITEDRIRGFFDDWTEKRDHDRWIFIDCNATRKGAGVGDIELREPGEELAIELSSPCEASVAYDLADGTPLFYEEHWGPLEAAGSFKSIARKAQAYGYRQTAFILDRGRFRQEAFQDLEDEELPFVTRIEGSNALVSERVLARAGTFETNFSCYCGEGVYGVTDSALILAGRQSRFLHFYLDAEKLADERCQVQMKVQAMKEHLNRLMARSADIPEICGRYFTCEFIEDEIRPGNGRGKGAPTKRKVLAGFKAKEDVIERELKLCGYFCLVTSQRMTAKEALDLYQSRDAAEELFRIDRPFLGTGSTREGTAEEVSGRLFVEFIALIIRSRLYSLLRKQTKKLNGRTDRLTVPAALRELEKIELVRTGKRAYKLDHAMTARQKSLLSALGIKPEEVVSKSAEVAERLAKAKDPEPERDEEEEEVEGVDFDFGDF